MASCNYAAVIRVDETFRKGGYWLLTSNDLPGFVLCGKDIKTLRDDVPAAIKILVKANYDMDVEVRPLIQPSEMVKCKEGVDMPLPEAWTAVPITDAA